MSDLLVRPVAEQDSASWRPLWDGYKAARGRGVGHAPIEAVYARAAAAGGYRVYWQTFNTNSTAMLLYDKVADKPGITVYRKNL